MPISVGAAPGGLFGRPRIGSANPISGSVLPPITTPGAAAPAAAPIAPVWQPPEVTSVETKATPPSELVDYSADWKRKLADYEKGADTATKAKTEALNADIERQVAAAKEQAAAEGRPFDEGKMRAELARGKFKSMSDDAAAREAGLLNATAGGLGIVQAPSESAMKATGLNLEGQNNLMNYWLGKSAASRDASRLGVEASRSNLEGILGLLRSLSL